MEKNPCYTEANVYMDVDQQRSIPTSTRVLADNTYAQEKTAVHAKANKKKKCLLVSAVVVIISLLVLLLLGASVLAVYSRVEIAQLEIKMVQLEQQLNQSKQQSQEQFDKLQEAQEELRWNATNDLNELQSSVETLNTAKDTTMTQLSSLQSSVDTLNTAQNTSMTQLGSLQSSVDTLTTRVNSPVNLYQNCIQDSRSCNVHYANDVWRGCGTSSLPLHTGGYYTTDVRCQYNVNIDILDSSILWANGNTVWCNCDVTSPNPSGHNTLSTLTSGTCTLVVTRCPTTLYLP